MPVRVACEPRRPLLVSRPRSSCASSRSIPPALSRPRPIRCRRPLPPPRRPRTASGRCRRRTTPARATASSTRSTPATSSNLKVAWTFSTGVDRGPGGGAARRRTTRCTSSRRIPNILYALDLTQARRAAEVEVRAEARSRPRRASPAATSSTAARVYADGKIFFNTLDGHTVARRRRDRQGGLDARSSATSTRARR